MDMDQIRALVDLVVDAGIAEFEVEHEGLAVKIRLYDRQAVVRQAVSMVPAGTSSTPLTDSAIRGTPTQPIAALKQGRPVTSPMVGTIFRAPEPGAPNFIEVGQRVSVGDALCIIETMKTMNEIESEFAGTVREICVEDGQPVEAEAVLFFIEPS